MKQWVVHKAVKQITVAGFAIIFALSGGLAIKGYIAPRTENQSVQIVAYTIETTYVPKVVLKANNIYNQSTLSGNALIVRSLMNGIDNQLTLTIKTTPEAVITGKLMRTVRVKSLYGEKAEVLWEKSQILKDTPFEGKETITLKDHFTEDLSRAKAFLETAFAQSGMQPGSIVEVGWDYAGTIQKDGKKLPFSGVSKVLIPMSMEVFKLELLESGKKEDQLSETLKVPVQRDQQSMMIVIGLSFVGALGVVLAVLLLKVKPRRSVYESELEDIFKNFGERLAKLDMSLPNQFANMITVNELMDLVKISDEIRQPIFYYQVDETDEKKIEFYVFDESRIYYLVKFEVLAQKIDYFLRQTS